MVTKWTPLGRVAATAVDYHADMQRLSSSRKLLISEVIAAIDANLPEDMVAKCAGVTQATVREWTGKTTWAKGSGK